MNPHVIADIIADLPPRVPITRRVVRDTLAGQGRAWHDYRDEAQHVLRAKVRA